MLSIIVAMSENHVIGKDGSLPWHLPGDLAHFKKTTMGRPIIMGRKTFDSLGRPLPGRVNIIVTRNPSYHVDGAVVANSVNSALDQARAAAGDDGEIFILGGAEIYRQVMPSVDRMIITHVHAHCDGDTFFPEFDPAQWRITEQVHHDKDQHNTYAYTICTYERINNKPRS